MPTLMRVVAVVVMMAAGACATSGTSASTSRAGGTPRWTAQLKQVEGSQASAVLTGRTNSTRGAYGDIIVTTKDTLHAQSTVDLSVSAPTIGATQLAWAIFTGPCGSPTPSVIGVNEFPPLEVTSGNARVRLDLNFALRQGAEYHVNVYNSSRATDVSNVMMCAPLQLAR